MIHIFNNFNISPRKTAMGFTLIELMITVFIISLIAAIAIPSYRSMLLKNSEEQGRRQVLSVADQLSNWRSKRLSYKGFIPINEGCPTAKGNHCYSNATTGVLYSPLGSNASTHNYAITIIDAAPGATTISGKPLTDKVNALGHGWRIRAVPNSSNSLLNYADTYYMDSLGQRCSYKSGITLPSMTTPTINCTGAGITTW